MNARNSGSYFTFSSRTLIVMVSGRVMTLITSSTASGYRPDICGLFPRRAGGRAYIMVREKGLESDRAIIETLKKYV